jgi:hypothetical protein
MYFIFGKPHMTRLDAEKAVQPGRQHRTDSW